jgi:hypothetical protein
VHLQARLRADANCQSEFADDKGVRQDRSRIEQRNEGRYVRRRPDITARGGAGLAEPRPMMMLSMSQVAMARNRFLANALPEPDLKYRSRFLALVSSVTAT